MRHTSLPAIGAMLCTALFSPQSHAQLAISANDGKAVLVNGVNSVPPNPAADYVAVIDLSSTPPRIVGEVTAPASLVGPPQSVAVSRDESLALVTAARKINPDDSTKVVPDDRVTVIDLKSSPPKVLATLRAGKGPAGVSINPSGTLALVANHEEGTISIFSILGTMVTPSGKLQLGGEKSGPSHVAFTPDGKSALVTRDGDHKISVLSIEGSNVTYTKRDMVAGIRPYGLDISSKGDVAVIVNAGGGQGDADVISVIDISAKPPRIVDTLSVGPTPEGVTFSADGSHLAVVLWNGTNKPKNSPFYNDHGLVKIFSVKGTKVTPVTESRIGNWCQGAAWSKNGRTLVVQCMTERELQVFSFDGRELKPEGAIKLNAGPAGIRTAQ
jgi:WD40 repeat protein